MKLRIKGNSVRLRLSRSEVEKLSTAAYIEERTSFGNNVFVYALQTKTEGSELSADFDGNKITIFIPEAVTKDWAENNTIGFDAKIETGDNDTLFLLVEKDFQCLDGTTEDQSDNYENPKSC